MNVHFLARQRPLLTLWRQTDALQRALLYPPTARGARPRLQVCLARLTTFSSTVAFGTASPTVPIMTCSHRHTVQADTLVGFCRLGVVCNGPCLSFCSLLGHVVFFPFSSNIHPSLQEKHLLLAGPTAFIPREPLASLSIVFPHCILACLPCGKALWFVLIAMRC
jgi:hypothetical protein